MRYLSISLTMLGLGIVFHWIFLEKSIEIIKFAPILLFLGLITQGQGQ